jgi:excisionase family DNA binding protein
MQSSADTVTSKLLIRENTTMNLKLNKIISLLEGKNTLAENWIDMSEASVYSGLSKSTIRRALKSKHLHASISTGKHLFKRTEIERWLTS